MRELITNSGLTFADASEKKDKTQLKPAPGESRGLGDGFSRAQAPDGFHQVPARWRGEGRDEAEDRVGRKARQLMGPRRRKLFGL